MDIQIMGVISFVQLYLALPIVQTISCTDIVVTPIIEYIIYGVKLKKRARISIILGGIGVITLANNKWFNG